MAKKPIKVTEVVLRDAHQSLVDYYTVVALMVLQIVMILLGEGERQAGMGFGGFVPVKSDGLYHYC